MTNLKVFKYLSQIIKRLSYKLYVDPRNQTLNSQIENIFDLIGNLTYYNQRSKIEALPFFADIPTNIWNSKKSLSSCLSILLDNFQLSLYHGRDIQKKTIRDIADHVLEEVEKQNISKTDITLLKKIVDLEWKYKSELINEWEKNKGYIFLGKVLKGVIKNKSRCEILLKKRAY